MEQRERPTVRGLSASPSGDGVGSILHLEHGGGFTHAQLPKLFKLRSLSGGGLFHIIYFSIKMTREKSSVRQL